MYQSPDFVKVNVNVKDVFATYTCPVLEGTVIQNVVPCEGTPGAIPGVQTYIEMGMGDACYFNQTA